MNTTNNNNNTVTCEIPFYKVMKNTFLFKKILQSIHATEWIDYKNHKQIHYNNRIQFKDITSMDWLINNNQYQILKCKLKAFEYIKLDHDTLVDFFRNSVEIKLENDCGEDNENDIINSELISYNKINNIKQLKIDKPFFKELLILLMKNKTIQHQLKEFDLPFLAVKGENIDAIEILTSEPYSLPLYPSTLEYAISNTHPSIVLAIINLISNNATIKISPETISKSISLTMVNQFHKEVMIKLILDNPQLYSTNTDNRMNKKVKLEKNNSSDAEFQEIENQLDIIKLDVIQMLELKSDEIKTKLLELNYIKSTSHQELRKRYSQEKKLTYLLDKNDAVKLTSVEYYKSISTQIDNILNQNGNIEDRLQKIHRILAMESNDFYVSFLSKYGTPPNKSDINFDKTFQECVVSLNLDALKSLIGNQNVKCRSFLELKTNSNLINSIVPECNFDSNNNNSIDFIKIYSSQDFFINYSLDMAITRFMFSIESESVYISILNEIKNSKTWELRFDLLLPEKWDVILSKFKAVSDKTILVESKESIDWLFEFVFEIDILKKNFRNIQFSTCQLVEYFKEQLKSNGVNIGDLYIVGSTDQYYSYPFIKSIYEGDLKTLEYIYQLELNGNLLFEKQMKWNKTINKIQELSNEKVISVVKVLNSNRFKYFSNGLFMQFIKSIEHRYNSENFGLDLKDHHIEHTIQIFIKSIFDPKSTNRIILFLNSFDGNFNIVENNSNLFINYWNEIIQKNVHHDSVYIYFKNQYCKYIFKGEYSTSGIISVIQLLLDQYNKSSNKSTNYSIIFNHLYKRLLQSHDITIDKVYYTFNLLLKSNIMVQHSFYQAFYYIGIKSIKLQLFVMELPKIIESLRYYGNQSFYYLDQRILDNESHSTRFNIGKHLKPDSFTFDFIYNSTFSEILFELMGQINYTEVQVYENYCLEYLLEIKRIDLFFKQLESSNQINASLSLYRSALRSLDKEEFKSFIQRCLDESIATFNNCSGRFSLELKLKHSDTLLQHGFEVINTSFTSFSEIIKYGDTLISLHTNGLISIDCLKYFICEYLTIEIWEFFMKINPDHQYLKITNSTIKNSIKHKNIGFLQHCFNSIIKNDKNLLKYLKSELSKHKDYKYLDWSLFQQTN